MNDNNHLLQLKSDYNPSDLLNHFIPYLESRLFAYQVLWSLKYLPKIDKSTFAVTSEPIFDGLTARFKVTITGPLENKNNLADRDPVIDINWEQAPTFLTIGDFKDILVTTTSDIDENIGDEGPYYSRSLSAALIRAYRDSYPEYFNRNFNSIKYGEADQLPKLNQNQVVDHLKSLKCLQTGVTGQAILDPEFKLFKE